MEIKHIIFALSILSFVSLTITDYVGFGTASYVFLLAAYGTDLYNRAEEAE